jgi:hypothetical protein
MNWKHTLAGLAAIAVLAVMLVHPFDVVRADSGDTSTQGHNLYCISYTTENTCALTVAPGAAFKIEQVTYKLSDTSTGNLTLSVDAGAGAAYDATIYTVNVATQGTSWAYRPADGWLFSAADECEIAYTNGDNRTAGIQVWYSILP